MSASQLNERKRRSRERETERGCHLQRRQVLRWMKPSLSRKGYPRMRCLTAIGLMTYRRSRFSSKTHSISSPTVCQSRWDNSGGAIARRISRRTLRTEVSQLHPLPALSVSGAALALRATARVGHRDLSRASKSDFD